MVGVVGHLDLLEPYIGKATDGGGLTFVLPQAGEVGAETAPPDEDLLVGDLENFDVVGLGKEVGEADAVLGGNDGAGEEAVVVLEVAKDEGVAEEGACSELQVCVREGGNE